MRRSQFQSVQKTNNAGGGGGEWQLVSMCRMSTHNPMKYPGRDSSFVLLGQDLFRVFPLRIVLGHDGCMAYARDACLYSWLCESSEVILNDAKLESWTCLFGSRMNNMKITCIICNVKTVHVYTFWYNYHIYKYSVTSSYSVVFFAFSKLACVSFLNDTTKIEFEFFVERII